MADSKYYELYRRSSLGTTLADTLDGFISNGGIEPQLALKILMHFDKAVADVISEKVKARLSFKGHLDTYRFCDEVWTFIIKDTALKLDNTNSIQAEKIKIVSCNTKRPECACSECFECLSRKKGKGHNSVRSDLRGGGPEDSYLAIKSEKATIEQVEN